MLKRALEFHAAIRVPAEARAAKGDAPPYEMQAFFNRRQPTPLSANFEDGKIYSINRYPHLDGGKWVDGDYRGDGTVPSFASVPIGWPNTGRGVAAVEMHAALPGDPALRDFIVNWISPIPAFMGGGDGDLDAIALDVPAVCTRGDDLNVTISARGRVSGKVHVVDVNEGGHSASRPFSLPGDDAPVTLSFGGLPEAVYRVTVRPIAKNPPPIGDYAVIVGR